MTEIAQTFADYFKAWNIQLPETAMTTRQPGTRGPLRRSIGIFNTCLDPRTRATTWTSTPPI